ncbi:MAG: hypothetical protein IT424_06435 [Pirellulales bacterium]|nr:hypothetical protein [Pirellulales bacterium]
MAKAKRKPAATFELRFVAPDLVPEAISLRNVSDALAAVQDLAVGRDPWEMASVPAEKSIGLLDVKRGSAVFECLSHSPQEAIANLSRVAGILSDGESANEEDDGDRLIAALRPIKNLSDIASRVGCVLEVRLAGRHRNGPLFTVGRQDFQRISRRLMLTGETTVIGTVLRVGGATRWRCLMRVPGRRRALYCDVRNRDLLRRLGEHLTENIVATGTATWIHRTWRIYRFEIKDFTQPHLGNVGEAIGELRNAGLSAWDKVSDPRKYLGGMR